MSVGLFGSCTVGQDQNPYTWRGNGCCRSGNWWPHSEDRQTWFLWMHCHHYCPSSQHSYGLWQVRDIPTCTYCEKIIDIYLLAMAHVHAQNFSVGPWQNSGGWASWWATFWQKVYVLLNGKRSWILNFIYIIKIKNAYNGTLFIYQQSIIISKLWLMIIIHGIKSTLTRVCNLHSSSVDSVFHEWRSSWLLTQSGL